MQKMWSSPHNGHSGTDMVVPNANARPPAPPAPPPAPPQPEDDANSQDEASTADEAGPARSVSIPRKRMREKYQKTSCELCKARKVKCDRAEPACSWCARHNRTCVYLERQRPGSRAGAVINLELEVKLSRIDTLLQNLDRRLEEHISQDHSAGSRRPLSPAFSNQNASPFPSDGRLSSNAAGLSRVSSTPQAATTPSFGSFGWQGGGGGGGNGSSMNGVLNGSGDQQGSAQMQLSMPPPSSDSFSQVNPSPGISEPQQRLPSIRSSFIDLPPHDMLYTLVDLYFKHCNTWVPILDRKTTFAAFFGSTSLEEPDRILLCAIVATTLRFFRDPRLTADMRAHYHAVSRQAVRLYALDHVSVPALRALVITTLDELGTSNGLRGWNLLSLLAQSVKQLDLCEEGSVYLSAQPDDAPLTGSARLVAAGEPDSWIEDEGRRRLCWVVYLLDRYATIATTSLDFLLDDRRMRRFLPCSYDLFSRNLPVETRSCPPGCYGAGGAPAEYAVNKPENLGSFSYHCEILRILSRVHEFLHTPVDITSSADMAGWRNTYRSLDSALGGWLQGLPSEYSKISALCHSDPASRVANWFMLHSAYVTSVVRLHSSAAYPAVRSHIFTPSHYAMQRCLSAVHSLADIAQDVLEANGLDLLGPPFAFSLWVAARLLLVHAAAVGCPVDAKIDFFVETLRRVGQHWEVANNYAKILTRMAQRGRQGDMSFAAMRRSAFDLVLLTSTTRRTGMEQTSTQVTSLSELDSIDVFEFFNYPRTLEPASMTSSGLVNSVSRIPSASDFGAGGGGSGAGGTMPSIESDWLRY